MNVLMLHGMNHHMFGKRDPAQYGTITLDEIHARLTTRGRGLGVKVAAFQTNSESGMGECIHQAFTDGLDAAYVAKTAQA